MGRVTADKFPFLFEAAESNLDQDDHERHPELTNLNNTTFLQYRDFIVKLLIGGEIRRTMSGPAVEYPLARIRDEYGIERLKLALDVLDEHIAYRRNDNKNPISLFKISERYRADIESERYSEIKRKFQYCIEVSLRDPAKERLARLASASLRPTTRAATLEVFVRNPDVVAEALILADGMCGHCGKQGPFRRINGSLYLEVHHRVPLAEGGDDSVANTVALCPNCHREAHFGENWMAFRP